MKPHRRARRFIDSSTGRYDQHTKYRSASTERKHREKAGSTWERPTFLTAFFKGHVKGLKVKTNGYAWGHCPFHDDHSPSFCVNLLTGRFACLSSSCNVGGRGLVSFVSCLYGFSVQEAREYLEDWA